MELLFPRGPMSTTPVLQADMGLKNTPPASHMFLDEMASMELVFFEFVVNIFSRILLFFPTKIMYCITYSL